LKPAKRTPVFVWALVAIFLVAAGMSGMRAMDIVKTSQKIAAPPSPAAPEPPEFAMDKSVPEKEPDRVPEPVPESAPELNREPAPESAAQAAKSEAAPR
jgi:hypothetical protein